MSIKSDPKIEEDCCLNGCVDITCTKVYDTLILRISTKDKNTVRLQIIYCTLLQEKINMYEDNPTYLVK